ncbi:leucine--tRNA ligase [Austwickia sp. TVS 96-490-7B]|uniref:leucine--tRNA ligase n=1 Tax=Austwickia sp. TVS 96-490-7B TaxID=2830843 RepID=UPI001C55CC50|nr:leucine--tRNA ligase [Austwickia sp. TVS 96-490-7B]
MNDTPFRYTAALAGRIETTWQQVWEEQHTFHAPNPAGPLAATEQNPGGDRVFVMDMFPYPSGAGLHVGHPLGYIATDVFARYQRMIGNNVLHTLGYDAFGLPAEQYAVQTGQHPRVTTEANITTMKRQLRRLGLGHDDRRGVATIDEDFYRWTQWIFLQIYNSWYDEGAPRRRGEGTGRARPITELIEEYAAGRVATPDGRPWADLTVDERRDAVDARRLAYVSAAPVNWCPGLGTVLSNEEVTNDGRSERGNFPVFKRNLSQWMMRITAYADRLVDDLDRLDWPEPVKLMQRNWIGRSQGARVRFAAQAASGAEVPVEVFTTRPDTLFGSTFMVLAPEHPLVDELVPQGGWPQGIPQVWTGGAATPAEAVAAYRLAASRKSDVERQVEDKDKTGVFTGGYAVNPVNGDRIPVFIADYVLMGYGTGAIMAVPAHDERDYAYARAFDLPIVDVISPVVDGAADPAWAGSVADGVAFTGDGVAVYSANDQVSLDGLGVVEAKARIISWLEEQGWGCGTVTYRLRDWLFSRQRYWGEPFPIVYDEDGHAHALPESMLPVALPEVPDYSPKTFDADDATSSPEPPLSRATDWVHVELDLGDGPRRYRRETNTMPNWAGSCWYELRYLDPTNQHALVDPQVEQYWMGPRDQPVSGAPVGASDPGGVDLYVGGVEHAVLHLLYSRFWHKVLFDLGHVSSEEPFRRLFNQGYVQAFAFTDSRGQYVPAAEVEEVPAADGSGDSTYRWQGQPVTREYGKMGKSLKNVTTPDEMYDAYGADTFRVYEMSMGPLDQSRPWETRAVVGSQRFLQRLWRLVVNEQDGSCATRPDAPYDDATRRIVHRTIDGVRADYENLRFNTAIAKLIECTNALTKLPTVPTEAAEALVLMTAPIAPHIAEEMWSTLGHDTSLAHASFPVADPTYLTQDTVTCVVQVQGKVRDRLEVPADITATDLETAALTSERITGFLAGHTVRKVIVRAPHLVNIVAG